MIFTKIQLGKQNTMNVVYTNTDGDTITMTGANVVHRDFKEALKSLVPHLALLTEQREVYDLTLQEVENQRSWDGPSVFTRITVSSVTINGDEISISGSRVLGRGDVIGLNTPRLSVVDDENYEYLSELSLAIDRLKYEAEQYVVGRKWGLKQGELSFDETADDPFAEVEAGDVPSATIDVVVGDKKKKGRKKKSEVVMAS